jgi:hypothetical protein
LAIYTSKYSQVIPGGKPKIVVFIFKNYSCILVETLKNLLKQQGNPLVHTLKCVGFTGSQRELCVIIQEVLLHILSKKAKGK